MMTTWRGARALFLLTRAFINLMTPRTSFLSPFGWWIQLGDALRDRWLLAFPDVGEFAQRQSCMGRQKARVFARMVRYVLRAAPFGLCVHRFLSLGLFVPYYLCRVKTVSRLRAWAQSF